MPITLTAAGHGGRRERHRDTGPGIVLPTVAALTSVIGDGVRATIEGRAVSVGRRKFMADDGLPVVRHMR